MKLIDEALKFLKEEGAIVVPTSYGYAVKIETPQGLLTIKELFDINEKGHFKHRDVEKWED